MCKLRESNMKHLSQKMARQLELILFHLLHGDGWLGL